MTGITSEQDQDDPHQQIYRMVKGTMMLKAGRMVGLSFIMVCFPFGNLEATKIEFLSFLVFSFQFSSFFFV